MLQPLQEPSVWDHALCIAPAIPCHLKLDAFTNVFADFIDLKTPGTLGHSRRVADLASRTAHQAGSPAEQCGALRHAGRIHDLGHIAIGNDLWEHPGSLSPSQWEVVRLHPYHAGRALKCSSVLAPLASIVAVHHERMDGSGYPHGLSAGAIPLAARILAVADVYAALREPRAHRPPLSLEDAVRTLQSEA